MSLIRFRLAQLFPIAALITAAAFTGCASSTVLQSQPPGARVFLNNVPVGTTPYTMTDSNIVGTATAVRLEYPGYQPLNTYIVRNEELDALALIGGLFLLVPFLWVLKYNPSHFYQLQPAVPGIRRAGRLGRARGLSAARRAATRRQQADTRSIPAAAAAAGRIPARARWLSTAARRLPAARRPAAAAAAAASVSAASVIRRVPPPRRSSAARRR